MYLYNYLLALIRLSNAPLDRSIEAALGQITSEEKTNS